MLKPKQIARICHSANLTYSRENGEGEQKRWGRISEGEQNSVIDGVKYFIEMGRPTPQQMHANWLRFKTSENWKYGIMKNAITKEHPCMVPYEDLPADQRLKDELFSAIVRVLTQDDPEGTNAGSRTV